jgi:transcriptional regulator with XRE-family HTH domain
MEKTIYTREYGVVIRLLKEARQSAGVTQVGLAQALGLTQSQVSKIERGDSRLDILQLRSICGVYRLTLGEFVRRLEAALKRRR